jgi:hypothetical protein
VGNLPHISITLMLCAFVDSPQCQCEDSRFFVAESSPPRRHA